ncbi:MAG: hypothetical protein IPO27_06320 [Bacteroidetes bacterium]|nr:hypothetical protein [Bacteroidota bacterium]
MSSIHKRKRWWWHLYISVEYHTGKDHTGCNRINCWNIPGNGNGWRRMFNAGKCHHNTTTLCV